MLLAQIWPVVGQMSHEALTADPIVLAFIVIVIIALTFFATSYFQGKRGLRDDDRWDMFFKAFTDEKSPMVMSNNRVAQAVEQGNKRTDDLTKALEAFGKKTDNQTDELNRQTTVIKENTEQQKEFNGLITRDLSKQTESMIDMQRSIDAFKVEIKASIDEISRKIDQVIQDKSDCEQLRKQLEAFKGEVDSKVTEQVKKATTELSAVKVEIPLPPPTPSSDLMGVPN